MNKLYRSLLVTGIVAAGLAGCGDDVTITEPPPPPPPPPAQVRSVTVAPDNISVNPGQTIQMTAAVTADAGLTPVVTWSVSDATKATVSATGLVTILSTATTGPVAVRATATANNSSASGVATLNVVGTTVTGVTVTPATANINAGTALSDPQTVQLAAVVTGSNNPAQTVTWESLAPTLATVSSTGLVTANNTATGGSVVIKVCSTVNPTICGTSSIIVVVPSPASVQIQSVTFTNSGGQTVPVVLTNVFGQIEIALNVEPGARNITRVDALIGGQVVATQVFTSAAADAAPEAAPTVIILSTNTAQLRQSSGIFVPVVFNGNSAITANLYVAGSSTPIASNSVPVVMNNPDAIVATSTASLVATNQTPSAVSAGGNTFFTGSLTVTGLHYIAFGKAVPVSVTIGSTVCGASANLIPASASATGGIALTGIFLCTGVEGPVSLTGAITVTYATGAVGPDGTPLVPPVGLSSVGSAFQLNGENRWNMIFPAVGPVLGPVFIDNLGPTIALLNVAFNDLFDQPWINASYTFDQDMSAIDLGIGLGTIEARVFDDQGNCTSLVVTNGSNFSQTTTSTNTAVNPNDWGKRICVVAIDALGNITVSGPSNWFGVDFVAPDARVAGSTAATPLLPAGTFPVTVNTIANSTIYSIAVPFPPAHRWGTEALDTRSGFNQNIVAGYPATESLRILNPGLNPAQTFTAQTLTTCGLTNQLGVALSDNYVRVTHLPAFALMDCGFNSAMYVWVTLGVTDRAGNASATIARNYAIDQYAPPTLASIGPSTPLYTAGQPAQFFLFGSDDLEIVEADLAIQYPNMATVTATLATLTKPLSSIAGAQRWDDVLTNILTAAIVTDPFFFGRIDFTCTAAGAPYADCLIADGVLAVANGIKYNNTGPTNVDNEQNPTAVGAVAYDVASQPSGSVSTPLLAAQTTDVAQPWASTLADIVTWRVLTPTGTTVVVEHKASTSIVAPFFDRVYIVRGNLAAPTTLLVCGEVTTAPALTDNGLFRFWTYTFSKPSSGPCFNATGSWGAIGVRHAAGLVTQLVP